MSSKSNWDKIYKALAKIESKQTLMMHRYILMEAHVSAQKGCYFLTPPYKVYRQLKYVKIQVGTHIYSKHIHRKKLQYKSFRPSWFYMRGI